MSFEHDIFISYAHIDNQTLSADQQGWIDTLHQVLKIRLQDLSGEKPNIWRDPKVQGNDIFGQKIVNELRKAAILVSVLSPGYIKSNWCRKELKKFLEAAEQGTGLYINNHARLFKVIKIPVPLEEHPPEMQELLGYEFYTDDPNTRHPRECNRIFGPDARQECRAKPDDLANEISGSMS